MARREVSPCRKGLFFKLCQSLHVQAVGFLVEVLHDLDVISTAEDLCQSILHQSPYFFIRSRRRRFGSCSFHQFPDDIELWIFFPVVIQQVHGGKPHRDIIGQTDKLCLVDRLQEFPQPKPDGNLFSFVGFFSDGKRRPIKISSRLRGGVRYRINGPIEISTLGDGFAIIRKSG